MKKLLILFFIISFFATSAFSETELERGKYLTLIGGCNDCHTSGFAPSQGKVPESEWLKGDSVGYKGPWGTSYPINLRKLVSSISKEQWITFMRNSKARPPMPTHITSVMPEGDLSAIYTFIKSLGEGGENAPAPLPPGAEPTTPYINFAPVIPGKK